ncbi:MAG: hypothetical protein M3R04_04560 [bacterium]|nr:hypothetical protein [bacterium]
MNRATLILLAALLCSATTVSGLRVENKTYKFAFTFAPDTELKYEDDGVGIVGTHVPAGLKKSDYGVLVYGSPGMVLTAAEALAIGYADHEAVLSAIDIADHAEFHKALQTVMELRGLKSAGEASVSLGETTLSVPYYTWEQSLAGRTHHALMYVIKHGAAFVYVQVESNKPLSKETQNWMASKLELL